MTSTLTDLFVPAVEETSFALDFAAALLLAGPGGGHVTAYHAVPDPRRVANSNPLWDMAEVEASFGERSRARQARLSETFERLRSEAPRGVSTDWQVADGDASILAPKAARASDLVVIHNRGAADRLNLSDLHLALLARSGRGVLLLPAALKAVPARILIAWNGSMEAGRAVAAAMPLLKMAERVDVLSLGEVEAHAPEPETLTEALRRKGIKAAILSVGDRLGATANQVEQAAGDIGADLIVMGAYGHARWRESILGGMTQHMLAEPKLPVLMAH